MTNLSRFKEITANSNTDGQSLTGVERAGDESEQVLSQSEELALTPFPAAHFAPRGGRILEAQHDFEVAKVKKIQT